MNNVTLLIGGNQGDRLNLIEQATEQIRQRIGSVVVLSSVYESEPWGEFEEEIGKGKVDNFLNRGLVAETTLSPWQVLRVALSIEADLGRVRNASCSQLLNNDVQTSRLYHSRPMDIDLIFYDNLVLDTPELTLPHPRMQQRRFVLEPLAEIMPEYRHPMIGKNVKELLSEL